MFASGMIQIVKETEAVNCAYHFCWFADISAVSWAACRRNQSTSEAPAHPVICFVQDWKLKRVRTQNVLNAPFSFRRRCVMLQRCCESWYLSWVA